MGRRGRETTSSGTRVGRNGVAPGNASGLQLTELLAVRDGTGERRKTLSEPAEVAAGAFEAALRLRAPAVHAPTPLVRRLAVTLGQQLGLDAKALIELELAVCVRDVGMIALPDALVSSDKPLDAEDWELMNCHPVVGAEMVEQIPVLTSVSEAIRFHHERWDGQGYPDGLKGDAIPLASRVIAASDAFVAMALDRPYRRALGAEVALDQVIQASGSQLDPVVVDLLVEAVAGGGKGKTRARRRSAARSSGANGRQSQAAPVEGKNELTAAVEALDVLPALAPAHERLLAVIDAPETTGGEVVAAVEDDVGLTVAVLRRAQGERKQGVTNISDAVSVMGVTGVREAVEGLPLSEFPWRSSPWAILLQRFRVHALGVARAAVRLAREADLDARDDVLVAALLHDVGKLVLSRARKDYDGDAQAMIETPEERVRRERRALGMDHAAIGALLLRRWGLPDALTATVADHHVGEDQTNAALVRLADMLVHHAQGGAVDRPTMLRLSYACGVHPQKLREVLFELPQAGGSQRRRAEPSPLSSRETEALRRLADGMVYGAIAQEMGVSASTIRSHLHSVYNKLGVSDRAQAVLRATEHGWI